jgi:2-oxoglutarate dehydrogenase E2 component (dihydrolipoamide succinyltransferase)
MAFDVRIPPLGESVTEGVILRWVKRDGDRVRPDDILLELETDKATMELPAERAGVLRILRREGERVAVGDAIARIEEGGAAEEAKAAPEARAAERARPQPAPAEPVKLNHLPNLEAASEQDTVTVPPPRGVGPLSPAVRRLIEEHRLEASAIPASGKGGRLTKDDVLGYLERAGRAAPPDPALAVAEAARTAPDPARAAPEPPRRAPAPSPADGEERVPMSAIRKRIAERLVQAQRTAAILTTFNEVDMSAVQGLRARYKDRFRDRYGVGLGFMSFFARATIAALREVPPLNAEIRGDDVVYKRFVHLGVAVATERGLVVPVVHDAHRLSFAEIEREIERLAARAREGKLALAELSGGTFTLTNGGIFGSLLSTPILNPPQSGILGMHKIEKRPVVVDDQIVVRPMMYVAVSYDHRLVDGEQAVTFLVRVKERLEDPSRLLLDV